MESKALEKLGILRKKRTFVGVLISLVRGVFVLCLVGACVFGGILFFRHRSASVPVSSGNAVTSATEGKRDDGDLHICEHLKAELVEKTDLQTMNVGGRMVATERQYWFRLSIDERWYLKSFVPSVKRYLGEIAPCAETETVSLDTKNLAYANDGADRLHKLRYGNMHSGDCYEWQDFRNGNRPYKYGKIKYGKIRVLLIDQVLKNGAITQATCYLLEQAEFEKLEHWIAREILRDRVGIAVTITGDGAELAGEAWSARDISPRPLGYWPFGEQRCYAMTPWINASRGERYRFLGCSCRNPEGLPASVSVKWSL